MEIDAVAAGIFAADATGRGFPAALLLRVKGDGAQSFEPVARFDSQQNRFVAVPIDFGAANDQVFLVLFGTGLRYRQTLSSVTSTIGGVDAETLFAGAQGGLVGLDQVNIRLPRSLTGRGEVDAVLTVAGKAANTVRVTFK